MSDRVSIGQAAEDEGIPLHADCFCRFHVVHPDVEPLPEGC